MILIESPINLSKTATSSHLDQQACTPCPDEKGSSNIASDGSFFDLDFDGEVKLFEMKVFDVDNTTNNSTEPKATNGYKSQKMVSMSQFLS